MKDMLEILQALPKVLSPKAAPQGEATGPTPRAPLDDLAALYALEDAGRQNDIFISAMQGIVPKIPPMQETALADVWGRGFVRNVIPRYPA